MPNFEIQVTGLDELIRRMGPLVGIVRLLRPSVQKSIYLLEGDLKKYPPPIPKGLWARLTSARQKRAFFATRGRNETFVRSGNLGRRWLGTIEEIGTELRGTLKNNADYAPWVQSDQFQAAFHRDRWPTDSQVVERRLDDITNIFNEDVARLLQ